jgi:hypothetical protein
MPLSPLDQLQSTQAALHALAQSDGDPRLVHTLSENARKHTELLAALPDKYTAVLHNLLDRLESSALFSEESCSFSQQDLLGSLQMWLDKAQAQLRAAA